MSKIARREFIKNAAYGALSLTTLGILDKANATTEFDFVDGEHIFVAKEAMYYEKLPEEHIKCKLCPRECIIGHRERGWCGVRENRRGTYYTLVHSNPCAVHLDPIEKKPLFHFLPSSLALSIATAGCNLNCKCCQNWQISQQRPEHTENSYLPPQNLVDGAHKTGCRSIAFTYSEPIIFYEYMLDTAKAARKENIRSVVVSAGYIQTEPLKELCQAVDAIKIDLKSFRNDFYKEYVKGELQPILNTLKTIKEMGVWLEIVVLVIPTLNDGRKEFRDMANWIIDNLGNEVPLHFSRFHPMYQLKNLPPTPISALDMARETAMDAGINYVYLGNVQPEHEGNNTYCPECGKMLIKRLGFFVTKNDIEDGKCKYCGHQIAGIWV